MGQINLARARVGEPVAHPKGAVTAGVILDRAGVGSDIPDGHDFSIGVNDVHRAGVGQNQTRMGRCAVQVQYARVGQIAAQRAAIEAQRPAGGDGGSRAQIDGATGHREAAGTVDRQAGDGRGTRGMGDAAGTDGDGVGGGGNGARVPVERIAPRRAVAASSYPGNEVGAAVGQRADVDAVMHLEGDRIGRGRRRRVGGELADRGARRPGVVAGDGVGIIIAVDGQRVIGVRHRLDIVGVQRQRRADGDDLGGAGRRGEGLGDEAGLGDRDGRAVGRYRGDRVGAVVAGRPRHRDLVARVKLEEDVRRRRPAEALDLYGAGGCELDLVAGAGLEIAAHHRQPGAAGVGVGGAEERRRCRVHGDGRAVGRDAQNVVGAVVVERSRNGDAGAAGHFLEGAIQWRAGDVLHLDRVRRHVEGHLRADQEVETVFQVDGFHVADRRRRRGCPEVDRRRIVVDNQGVVAGAAVDRDVGAVKGHEVVAKAAADGVGAEPAVEIVVAGAAVQGVVAGVAEDDVVARVARQRIAHRRVVDAGQDRVDAGERSIGADVEGRRDLVGFELAVLVKVEAQRLQRRRQVVLDGRRVQADVVLDVEGDNQVARRRHRRRPRRDHELGPLDEEPGPDLEGVEAAAGDDGVVAGGGDEGVVAGAARQHRVRDPVVVTGCAGNGTSGIDDVGHRHGDRLGGRHVGAGNVRRPDDDVVDVAGSGGPRRLEVRRRVKAQRAGRGVDGEQSFVGAALDRIGDRIALGVRRRHRQDRRRVLGNRRRRR